MLESCYFLASRRICRKAVVIVKLFDLLAKAFYFSGAPLPPKTEVQLQARIDGKGKFVDIIILDTATLLEKTKTP